MNNKNRQTTIGPCQICDCELSIGYNTRVTVTRRSGYELQNAVAIKCPRCKKESIGSDLRDAAFEWNTPELLDIEMMPSMPETNRPPLCCPIVKK